MNFEKYSQHIINKFENEEELINDVESLDIMKYIRTLSFREASASNRNGTLINNKIKLGNDVNFVPIGKINKLENKNPLLYDFLISEKTISFEQFIKMHEKLTNMNYNFSEIRKKRYNNFEINDEDKDDVIGHIMSLYRSSFVSLDILYWSEINDLYYYKYNDKHTKILMCTKNTEQIPKLNYILFLINLIREISGDNKLNVNINILYCNQKRFLPTKNKYIGPGNVNGGSSRSGIIINIMRMEDFYKVLIHELIHYILIDRTSQTIEEQLELFLKQNIKFIGNNSIIESYTEFLAILINICFVNYISNQIDKINDRYSINKLFNIELLFSCYQVAKIIKFFGGNKYNDIAKIKITQYTSVVSYYFVKTFKLINIDKLNDLFLKMKKNKFALDISKIENDYLDTYKHIFTIPDKFKQIIDNFISDDKNDKILQKTMRMSALQIL